MPSAAPFPDRLKRSLEAVRLAHVSVTQADSHNKVTIADRSATFDGMYLRILLHANEHMGQLVAQAGMDGIVPPWPKDRK